VRLLAHTDGGVDAGGTYIGVLLEDLDTGKVLLQYGKAAGPGTHNEAEYRPLLYALRQAEAWDAELRLTGRLGTSEAVPFILTSEVLYQLSYVGKATESSA
jgi:hypothetical protein